jgi:hypothetical protein
LSRSWGAGEDNEQARRKPGVTEESRSSFKKIDLRSQPILTSDAVKALSGDIEKAVGHGKELELPCVGKNEKE